MNVHRKTSMHTITHSCGSIHSLLPDLIEEYNTSGNRSERFLIQSP